MKKTVLLLAVILGLGLFVLTRGGDDPSEIEALFGRTLEAGRTGDLSGFMDSVSLRYRDEYGLSYVGVKRMAQVSLEKFEGLDGTFGGLAVILGENEAGEKTATATVEVTVLGMKGGVPIGLIGDVDRPDTLTVELVKSGFGGWKIVSVSGFDSRSGGRF